MPSSTFRLIPNGDARLLLTDSERSFYGGLVRISDLTGAHAEVAGHLGWIQRRSLAQKRGIPLKSAQRLVKETYDKLGVANAGELKVQFKNEVGR